VSRDVEGGRLDWGTLQLARVRTMVDWRYVHHGGGVRAHSPLPRLRAWGSRGGSYWTSRTSEWSGKAGMCGGSSCRRGSPGWVDTHGNIPRITKIFDDSGSSIILSRQVFQSD